MFFLFLSMNYALSIAIALSLVFSHASAQHTSQGKLFIIGGGSRSNDLIKKLVETADLKSKDYVVVLPMASELPVESFQGIAKQIGELIPNKITSFNFSKATVGNKRWVDSLRNARLIYIAGGSQDRFMEVVKNTPVYEAIHAAYKNGSTVAGTSAGAAVMSKVMITGQQLAGDTTYKETFDKLWDKNIEFKDGLGLFDSVIIDQHFLKRSRHNRLISALAAHPDYTCIGIDESTAIIVRGKNIEVSGESQVMTISEPQSLKVNSRGLILMQDLRFGLYADGEKFLIR